MSVPSETSGADDLRVFLRERTADLHAAAELCWFPDGDFASLDHYTSLLKVIYVAHQDLGAAAVALVGTTEEIAEEQTRRQALVRDTGVVEDVPNNRMLPSPAYAWGVLYVLNGSALGASFMLGRGHARPGWPISYLQISEDYVRSGRLRLFLDRINSEHIETEDALRGASDTFAMFAHDPTDQQGAAAPV